VIVPEKADARAGAAAVHDDRGPIQLRAVKAGGFDLNGWRARLAS
jgi:hypothetical protein